MEHSVTESEARSPSACALRLRPTESNGPTRHPDQPNNIIDIHGPAEVDQDLAHRSEAAEDEKEDPDCDVHHSVHLEGVLRGVEAALQSCTGDAHQHEPDRDPRDVEVQIQLAL